MGLYFDHSMDHPRRIQVAEDIVPIARFKARISEVVRRLRSGGRPIIVTQNGEAAAVMVSASEFDALLERAYVVDAIRAGLDDADAGRVISDAQLGRALRKRRRK